MLPGGNARASEVELKSSLAIKKECIMGGLSSDIKKELMIKDWWRSDW